MFALGAQHAINGHSEDYMELAKELAKTCHESYQRTGTAYRGGDRACGVWLWGCVQYGWKWDMLSIDCGCMNTTSFIRPGKLHS